MKLRPADLLETVRQMILEDRRVLVGLLNEAFPPLVMMKTEEDDGIEDKDRIEAIKKVLKEEHSYSGFKLATGNTITKQVMTDYFIQSNHKCPYCKSFLMQCESHYRCFNCGNVEREETGND